LRLVALVGTSVLALHTALGVWIVHPLRLLDRFGNGFLEFYDVKLQFSPLDHPRMEAVILVAVFASCAAVALAVAARRPVTAAVVLLVGAGWPATLLTGPDDLRRGAALLAVMLSLVFGLGVRIHPRRFVAAAGVGAIVVAAALAVSGSSAVASGQVLHWQGWDFYTKPQKPVSVEYVWNSHYGGLTFPKKVTTVLKVEVDGPPVRRYWRATTLDEFDGVNWFEYAVPVEPILAGDQEVVTEDPTQPQAAADTRHWLKQEVTVAALRDDHLTAASIPTAFDPGLLRPQYSAGGVATLPEPLSGGSHYTAWSYEAQPTPRDLARLPARYPYQLVASDLNIGRGASALPFGTPGRDAEVNGMIEKYSDSSYRRVFAVAKRVVGEPQNPYAAAVELEAWFRTGGGFRYNAHPRQVRGLPALAAFVLRTHEGYCQHFAGAMALMLRFLGVPARVAAGFTSGTYDGNKHEWLVTDHDAHTWVEAWFPRYGWLPFDPTPGRGSLAASYTASSPRFDIRGALATLAKRAKRGSFDLSKLQSGGPGFRFGVVDVKRKTPTASGTPTSSNVRALVELLVLVAAALVLLVVGLKLAVRKFRYLTRDPRRTATASVRELADFLADQGVQLPPSATFRELAAALEGELGVSARSFVDAATAARFGPLQASRRAAADARTELRRVLRELRSTLSRPERVLGLVSLRSLGLTG
jgi:transglutaminase-like putative cysteine protease